MIISYLKDVMRDTGKFKYIISVGGLCVLNIIICLQPYFLSKLVNNEVNYKYLLFFLISLLIPALINFIKNDLVQATRKSSKRILFLFLESRGYEYYNDYKSSTLQSLMSEISFVCRNLVQELLPSIVKVAVTVLFYTSLISGYSLEIGILYLLVCLIYMVLSAILTHKNRNDIKKALDSTVEVNKSIDDFFKNLDTVFSYLSFKHELEFFDTRLTCEKNIYYKIQKQIHLVYLLQQVILVFLISLILYIGLINFSSFKQQNLEFILILIYSVLNLSNFGTDFLGGVELKDRLEAALSKLQYGNNRDIIKQNHRLIYDGLDVIFDNISYCYKKLDNEVQVLKDLSCRFEYGKLTALIGDNGSGKSTVLKLIADFLIPDKGIIYQPLKTKVLYINQDSVLFNRSLLDNLGYPHTELTSDQLETLYSLAKKLEIDNIISPHTDLNVEITGEMTKSFSGGEKQKILILRALISDFNIILFDEITSGLDIKSSSTFYQLIKETVSNKVVICITHRKEELQYFDEIISLNI
ncbi:ATP-binding cassette domain-containing protein [Streptococcus mutans]|uniref:ATP-binding cassette domain-containing protein n=1 Tax=Streptococcus mutans TaxID=1309 RepID=UPI0038B7749B